MRLTHCGFAASPEEPWPVSVLYFPMLLSHTAPKHGKENDDW